MTQNDARLTAYGLHLGESVKYCELIGDNYIRWIHGKLKQRDTQSFGMTVFLFADHMDYIKNMVGIEHVGVGSDFDGIDE